jgi:hypothetical protein
MAKITLNHFTRNTISLRAVEMETRTGIEATSTKAMVATSMAIDTMEDSGETTPMAITMVITVGTIDTTMKELDNAISTQMLRRISQTSPATSARRLDTTPTTAQRTRLMIQSSPIHSRRDR